MTTYEFEDLLKEIGGFGRYQKRLTYLFLGFACFSLPFFAMYMLFIMKVPDHWCDVQGREAFNVTVEQWKNFTLPREEGNVFSKCQAYDLSFFFLNDSFADEDLLKINHTELGTSKYDCPKEVGWVYDRSLHGETLVSYYNWVCDDSTMVPFTFTLGSISGIVGLTLFSTLADKIGRTYVFFGTIGFFVVFGVALNYCTTAAAFFTVRFLRDMTFPASFQLAYVQVLEFMIPEKRNFINLFANFSWSLGLAILPVVAWLCEDHWKTLNLSMSLAALSMFIYVRFVKESPRWLLTRGRLKEAEAILNNMMKVNGVADVPDLKQKIEIIAQGGEKKVSNRELYKTLLVKTQIIRICIVSVGWTALGSTYYGINMNFTNMAGNAYTNFAALAAIEMPAYVITYFFIDKIGRRWTNFFSLLLGGASCVLISIVPDDIEWSVLLLAVIAKFFCCAGFMSMYMQAAEVFPTTVRAIALALPSSISGIAMLGVPYIVELGRHSRAIPYLFLGGLSIFAAPLILCLPETTNQSLPQTVEDAQTFGKGQRFWALNTKPPKSTSVELKEPPRSSIKLPD